MKQFRILVVLALVVGAAIFFVVYRRSAAAPVDELAWLRQEFRLDDRQFAEIAALHQAYRPVCDGHCADYMAAHAQLAKLLDSQPDWTPAVAAALRHVFDIERACREDMLKHAFAVSALMSPEQGRRYLAMVRKRALLLEPQELARATR